LVNLDFEVEGDDPDFGGTSKALERFGNSLAANLDAAMERLADEILKRLRQFTSVNARPWNASEPPGTTRDSWTVLPVGQGEFYITNSNTPVIDYITLGTAPHKVFPTFAKALHWIDDEGVDRFSKGHLVQGIIGIDIEDMVMTEMDPYIESLMDMAIDAADREAGFE
jgi:hypothetical protein